MTRTCAPRTQRFGAWLIDSALVFLLWYLCTGSDLETVNVLMQTLDPTQPGALDQFAQAIFKMLTAFGLKAAFCQTAYYCLAPALLGRGRTIGKLLLRLRVADAAAVSYTHLDVYKRQALDIVGMGEYADRRPGRISGGQRQRVALARAISKMPECFLMDEPLSNLDAKLRSDMRTELIQLHDTLKSTFIYVTHDQIEAMTMGTNIVVMNEGRIMQQGTPTEIHNDPN